jgi:isoleucyl-tRNA synthetase
VLVFTAEEAWTARFGTDSSVHLQTTPVLPPAWHDPALAERWRAIREQRRAITTLLEDLRKSGQIKSSLQAEVSLPPAAPFPELDWAELAIVSSVRTGDTFAAHLAPGDKCARCWKILPEVGRVAAHPGLCLRCAEAVG